MSTSSTADPAPAAAADPMAHTLALLQPWIEFVPLRQRRLGLFICLALLVHLLAFLLIRIDATRTEFTHQAHTHVTVEAPALESGTDDAFWDRLSDPRLFLLPTFPAVNAAPMLGADLSLGGSTLPDPAAARPYPLVPAATPSLAEQATAAMLPPRQPFSYADAPALAAPAGNWQWSDDLARRAPANMSELPSPVSDTDVSPTALLVSVDPAGTVRDVLLQETSQKPELDQQAILAARKVRFSPTGQPGLAWGRLTVFWHPTAPPREVVVPTPPSP